MSESIIGQKSFEFAVYIVKFYKNFITDKKEFVLSKQLLRSGTSIGANVREALNAQSKMDLFTSCLFPRRNVMKLFIGFSFCLKLNIF
uniref:four helix bundle protein n=1 Tax=uncultured Chryseobacterium sp. TaxID=259322 RepID=UPI0034584629